MRFNELSNGDLQRLAVEIEDEQKRRQKVRPMKLFLLERDNVHLDEAIGFVIQAENEDGARALAACKAGDEGVAAWASGYATCKEVGTCVGYEDKVIMESRLNG